MLCHHAQIGATRRVISAFTFHGGEEFMKNDIRVRNDGTGDPLGCLGDLGLLVSEHLDLLGVPGPEIAGLCKL